MAPNSVYARERADVEPFSPFGCLSPIVSTALRASGGVGYNASLLND